MSLKNLLVIVCFFMSAMHEICGAVKPTDLAGTRVVDNRTATLRTITETTGARERTLALVRPKLIGIRKMNPLKAFLSRPRVSPLYLINGTVCRFVNFQPVCTTLSTSGISVGQAGAARPAGAGAGGSGGGSSGSGGSGGGAARPAGGGGSSGGGGGGSGSSGAGAARPASSGVLSGGSSVQFANQPARITTPTQDESPDAYAARAGGASDGGLAMTNEPQATEGPAGGVLLARRPWSLSPFRRRPQFQLLTQRSREADTNDRGARQNGDKLAT